MRNHLNRYVALLVIGICIISFAASAMAQSSTSIKVEVKTNGDSIWITEKKIPLTTPEDIANWDATANNSIDVYRADFEMRMKDYVAHISGAIGRPMEVQGVNVMVEKSQPYAISDNTSITYGTIRYTFTWTHFATVRGNAIEVGDAFVDGFLLNKDDSIKFILPPNYRTTSVSPAYDDMKDKYQPEITWYANSGNNTDIRIFGPGEPSVTIRQSAGSVMGFDWWMLIPAIILSAIAGFAAAFFLFRKKEAPDAPLPILEMPLTVEKSSEPSPEESEPIDSERFMSDEEKIIRYLEESGGQMFQSDLVKKTDFSKSKLSMVLSDLKERGTIIKIKKGKENLIRINKAPAIKEDVKVDDE